MLPVVVVSDEADVTGVDVVGSVPLVADDVAMPEVVGESVTEVLGPVFDAVGATGPAVGLVVTLGEVLVVGMVTVPVVDGSVGAGLEPPVPQLVARMAPRTHPVSRSS